jgi:membrane-associated phospholipid phosphatase
MPSLHAAYPWLFFLFACRLWGTRGWLVILYPAAVFFAVVYLGHHYVADVIGGIVYASASYALVCGPVGEWFARLRWLPQRRSSPAAPPVAASTARS